MMVENTQANTPLEYRNNCQAILAKIRQDAPLIHNITNIVTANLTANALLAIGASPAMVDSPEEAAELAAISGALVINLGTLNHRQVDAIRRAVDAANAANVPIVMDPVAAGVLSLRTNLARELLDKGLAVIRGNASEILALSTDGSGGKGVDSQDDSGQVLEQAKALAARSGAVIAISGPVDYILDTRNVVAVRNGDAMMPRVTGLGCTATALTGACLSVSATPLSAAVAAYIFLGLAGERAGTGAMGPADLNHGVINALYQLDDAQLIGGAKIECL